MSSHRRCVWIEQGCLTFHMKGVFAVAANVTAEASETSSGAAHVSKASRMSALSMSSLARLRKLAAVAWLLWLPWLVAFRVDWVEALVFRLMRW